MGNDLGKVASGWVAMWAKHLVQGLYVDSGMRGQPGEADCGIDVITQQLLAECRLAREIAFDSVAKQPLSKCGVAFRSGLNRFSEIFCQSHFHSPSFCSLLPPLVVFPSFEGKPDIVWLALFGSAAKKDHNPLMVFAKVHAVSRAEIDPAFVNATSHTPDVGKISESHAV
jgi:hypothetical protein